MIKALLLIAGGLAGLYIAAVAALFFGQRSMIYAARPDAGELMLANMKLVGYRTADGLDLRGAYRPSREGRPTLVFFHGNGDDLAGAHVATRSLGDAGYGILLIEYRGYGGNPGSPTEEGLYRDGRAALDWLGRQGIADRQIVLIGNSLGSGVASQLAIERPIGGLVLVSPFTSLVDAAARRFPYIPVRLLLHDRYQNLRKLRGRELPLLVLHGEADTLIPSVHGVEVARAVPGSRLVLVPGVGHELAYLPGTQHEIARWIGSIMRPDAAQLDEGAIDA